MRFCENCGFRLPNPDARFCRNCGASLVEEEGAPAQQESPAAPTPPAAEAAPLPQQVETPPPQAAEAVVPPQVPAPQAAADAAQAKTAGRSRVNLVLGVVVAVQLVAIVVLALFIAFASGGTEAEEAAPEAAQDPRLVLAQEYVRALQEKDIDAYIACMDTSQMTKSDVEDYKDLIDEAFFLADMDIIDVEFEVTEIGESRAEVVTVSGTLEVLFEEELTTIDFHEDPVTIEMEKSGGEWFITGDPAIELGFEVVDF